MSKVQSPTRHHGKASGWAQRKLCLPSVAAEQPLSRPEITQQLRLVQRALEKVAKDMDDDRDIVDGVAFVVQELLKKLDQGESHPQRHTHARSLEEDQVLLSQAKAGAGKVEIQFQPNGGANVRIDGRLPFYLAPQLGALFAIICQPTGTPSEDGLIGWRTYDEVAALLTKRTGSTQGADSVTGIIYKLKAAVRNARENDYLIETDRHRSVRFRLRAPQPELSPLI